MVYENTSVYLRHYPVGMVKTSDMSIEKSVISDLKPGEVLLRNKYISLDPYMRGRLRANVKSYVECFKLDEVLMASTISVVEALGEGVTDIKVGDEYIAYAGWEKYTVVKQEDLKTNGQYSVRQFTRIDKNIPIKDTYYLGLFGMPGMTAWAFFNKVGKPKEGETIFVSAASGAVGQLVCQLAKFKGLRVVATASSEQKIDYLKNTLKVDEAFNYRDFPDKESLLAELSRLCPNGIDIYYDNVGGLILECVLYLLNVHARVISCGMISQYNATEEYKYPLERIIQRRILIQGCLFGDFFPECFDEFLKDMLQHKDKIVYKEHIYKGVEKAPEAFIGMFKSENFGKIIVEP